MQTIDSRWQLATTASEKGLSEASSSSRLHLGWLRLRPSALISATCAAMLRVDADQSVLTRAEKPEPACVV
jgi:hypothetical protein